MTFDCAGSDFDMATWTVLDAPGNSADGSGPYVLQICVSWPYRKGFLGMVSPLDVPESNQDRHRLVQKLAQTWAEPFRSIFQGIPDDTEIKHVDMQDWAPPYGFRSTGSVLLMGDALHHMVMCKSLSHDDEPFQLGTSMLRANC